MNPSQLVEFLKQRLSLCKNEANAANVQPGAQAYIEGIQSEA